MTDNSFREMIIEDIYDYENKLLSLRPWVIQVITVHRESVKNRLKWLSRVSGIHDVDETYLLVTYLVHDTSVVNEVQSKGFNISDYID